MAFEETTETNIKIVETALGETDKRIKIDWVSKEMLIADRERFVSENFKDEYESLKKFDKFGEDDLKVMARLSLISKFTIKKLKEMSPIKVKVPSSFVAEPLGFESSIIGVEHYEAGGVLEKVVFNINLDKINQLIFKEKEPERVYQSTLNILDTQQGHTFEEAKKIAITEKDLRVADLDIWVMGTMAQEFGHVLFAQSAMKSEKKYKQLEISGWNNLFKDLISEEKWIDSYLALDIEVRGRIWELAFLKEYFPNSRFTEQVKAELKRGLNVRELRRADFESKRDKI